MARSKRSNVARVQVRLVGSDFGRALAADLGVDRSGHTPGDLVRFWAVLGARMARLGWGLTAEGDQLVATPPALAVGTSADAQAPRVAEALGHPAHAPAVRQERVCPTRPLPTGPAPAPSLLEPASVEAQPHQTVLNPTAAAMSAVFAQFADD